MKRLLLILLMLPVFAEGQIITTVAGNGISGYAGDGGPAFFAEINNPFGFAIDSSGNIYFADELSNVVRKISKSGIISTIAGNGTSGFSGDGGPAFNAQLNYPFGVALDGVGNLYIADEHNYVIRKVSTTGVISSITGFTGPTDIATDQAGNLYIAYEAGHVIRKMTPSGLISIVAGNGIFGYSGDGGFAIDAELSEPVAVVADNYGNIYFADIEDNVIRKVDNSGIITTVAGSGITGHSGDGGNATSACLNSPSGVAIDALGNVYIADQQNNRVRIVDNAGIIHTAVGSGSFDSCNYSGDGGSATNAELCDVHSVALDKYGNLYIADAGNSRIRKVNLGNTRVNSVTNLSSKVKVSPNPTTTLLTITSSNKITDLSITNLLGQTIYAHEYNTEKVQIDVAGLPAGMYLLKINGTEVRKFLKQ